MKRVQRGVKLQLGRTLTEGVRWSDVRECVPRSLVTHSSSYRRGVEALRELTGWFSSRAKTAVRGYQCYTQEELFVQAECASGFRSSYAS